MDVQQLVKEAKHGSAAAQKCMFDLYADKLMLLCMRYVKINEDAEETLLDGFYKFFKNIALFSYRSEAELYTFLKRIMINECLMMLRRKNSFSIVTEAAAEEIPLQEEALDNLSAKEIFDLIVQLPVGYRTVFNLHVLDGYKHEEIAQQLKISVGASKSNLAKARMNIQKMLKEANFKLYERQKAI